MMGSTETSNHVAATVVSTLDDKLVALRAVLAPMERVAVAFSAGVDSTLVLKLAIDVLGGDNVVAVTGRSDSLAKAEFEQAGELAARLGVRHVVLDTDEMTNPNYASNPTNRCYYCKSTLYERLEQFIAEQGFHAIVDGTNADDLGDHRPGMVAAQEHHVRSPLAEAGLTKADVRALSRRFDLPTFDKPAAPCLSSRVPYGEPITPEKLRMIEGAEALLHGLGIRECRVRHHGELARIEVPPNHFSDLLEPETAERVHDRFRALGFSYVTIDLRGFRSGSLNETVQLGVGR